MSICSSCTGRTSKIPLGRDDDGARQGEAPGPRRHVGVANFNIALLDQAIALCPEPLVTLQAEYHPYLDQTTLLDACRRARADLHRLLLPLGRGRLFKEPVLAEIARQKGKTIAQVALRWLVQKRDRRAHSALVELGSPGREHGGVRFLAQRRGDEAHRCASSGRMAASPIRPAACRLGMCRTCTGLDRPHGEEHAIAGAASHAGLARASRTMGRPIGGRPYPSRRARTQCCAASHDCWRAPSG